MTNDNCVTVSAGLLCNYPRIRQSLEILVTNLLTKLVTVVRTSLLLVVFMPPVVLADSGFYIGGSIGSATLEANTDDLEIPGLPSNIDEDDTGYKVFAGYKFDLVVFDLGIEAGYVDFGQPKLNIVGETLEVDTTGINIWGVAGVDLGPLQLFGKLGYLAWDVEATLLGQNLTDDGSDIGYGAGLGFSLGPVQIRTEYELYDLDEIDMAMWSVGIAYQFN